MAISTHTEILQSFRIAYWQWFEILSFPIFMFNVDLSFWKYQYFYLEKLKNWKLSKYPFWPGANETETAVWNFSAMYFIFWLKVWERPWNYKDIKMLKLEGKWDELQAKSLITQSITDKTMEKSKELKQNWIGLENFDICFYQNFVLTMKTGN